MHFIRLSIECSIVGFTHHCSIKQDSLTWTDSWQDFLFKKMTNLSCLFLCNWPAPSITTHPLKALIVNQPY